MAFGKTKDGLDQIAPFNQNPQDAAANFRQMGTTLSKNPGKRGGSKGNIPYFVDMFQPSTMEIDTIRLVPGKYGQEEIIGEGDDVSTRLVLAPFIKFVDHFDGHANKGAICSAGVLANYKGKRKPCHGCDIFWATVSRNSEGRLESSRISRQNKYVFAVLDYGRYHKMPVLDRESGKQRANATGDLYWNWDKCKGQGCDACRAGIEYKQGDMRHWPMNYTQFQVLRDAQLHIGKSCTACGQLDCIQSLGWQCPSCHDAVIDMGTTALKTDEILKLTDNPYRCMSCGQEVLLKEEYECSNCAPVGRSPVRASLFDVDLRVKLVENANAKGKSLQVLGWSPPRPVDPNFVQLVEPIDLVARYAPGSMEYQKERLGPVPVRPAPDGTPQTSTRQPVTSTSPQGGVPYVRPFGDKQ